MTETENADSHWLQEQSSSAGGATVQCTPAADPHPTLFSALTHSETILGHYPHSPSCQPWHGNLTTNPLAVHLKAVEHLQRPRLHLASQHDASGYADPVTHLKALGHATHTHWQRHNAFGHVPRLRLPMHNNASGNAPQSVWP
jgi:hypothetical protein